MYSDIGQKSNTMIFSDRPADVNALIAQASAVVRSMSVAETSPTKLSTTHEDWTSIIESEDNSEQQPEHPVDHK